MTVWVFVVVFSSWLVSSVLLRKGVDSASSFEDFEEPGKYVGTGL